MTYVLHYAPDNASMIFRLALEHLGVAYQTALVDRAAGGQNAAAYLALNPNGLIPVLETPQGPIFLAIPTAGWGRCQRTRAVEITLNGCSMCPTPCTLPCG